MTPITVLIIILVYFSILILISHFTSRKADNQSFFLGNKKSPWYVVAFGMIGASLSGVTFISVPGWVGTSQFAYMQIVAGYLLGYTLIALILIPLYYRLNLTSIYTYLEQRFGIASYKTGAFFFLISKTFGAAARLYVVAMVLQLTVFDALGIPFGATVIMTILLIWVYTFRGGIKTIIWTDTLQTFFMLLAVIVSIVMISRQLNLSFSGVISTVADSDYSRIFFFEDFIGTKHHFFKHFFGGMFIALTMTGLDQDMMQKNLSCKNIREAQKNIYWFSFSLIFVNLIFLSLGALLYIYAGKTGIALPETSDQVFPLIATGGHLGSLIAIVFMIGIIAAAFSSADSALTALTTSFTVDFLGIKNKSEEQVKKLRKRSHVLFSVILFLVILFFRALNNQSIIDTVFTIAGYTYGPLLGLYTYGLFSKRSTNDKMVPFIAVLSPVLCYLINDHSDILLGGYQFGFELIILNGGITLFFLWVFSFIGKKEKAGK